MAVGASNESLAVNKDALHISVSSDSKCDILFIPETQSYAISIPLTVQIPVEGLLDALCKKNNPMAAEPATSEHASVESASAVSEFDSISRVRHPQRGRCYSVEASSLVGRSLCRKWSVDSASFFRKGSFDANVDEEEELLLRLATSEHVGNL